MSKREAKKNQWSILIWLIRWEFLWMVMIEKYYDDNKNENENDNGNENDNDNENENEIMN